MNQDANAASVAVIEGERVLLIQRAYAPYQHLWTLPGGRTDPGESPIDCARREVAEETGLTLGELVHVETQSLASSSGNWRLAVFASPSHEGAIIPSDEIADHRWVRLDDVAAMRTTSRLHDVLVRAFASLERT
jgi:8-oxo-dGTP pyrophosphatase MutT (NUDIX family)